MEVLLDAFPTQRIHEVAHVGTREFAQLVTHHDRFLVGEALVETVLGRFPRQHVEARREGEVRRVATFPPPSSGAARKIQSSSPDADVGSRRATASSTDTPRASAIAAIFS
ncbi:hypothetical protein [Streptomyces sp. Ac-502]|uniref:hypothetical protein n=1 Tax=Streptomyces sp. Ac-502 TaxID=3342801 RepID=UPI0038624FF0